MLYKLDFTKLDGIADYLTDTKIVNMYGITETTVHVTHHLVRDTDIVERVSKIGTPLPTLTVRLVDKALNPVPNGLTGEMLIVGEGVARGYLNQPELTADRFPIVNEDTTSRAYLSGDLAYYHNGGLIYLGRNDRQIKVNGFRIELDEIKFAIVKYPGVDACEVLVYNERIVAFVIMKKEVHRGALRSFLRKRLVEYMLPSRIVSVKSIPLTANGKIDREKLIAGLQVGRGPGEKIPYCKHRDAVTLKLATIWQEVTGYPINDYNADFFSHGGDSIRAIRLCNQVNNSFKINFRVSNVFKHNTILAQATFIRSQLKIGHCSSRKIPKTDAIERLKQKIIKEKSSFLPLDYEDLYPATDIQKGMLIHILQDRNDTTYHDQSYMQFESADFDQAIFAKAVGLMEIKHSILRTSFDFENFDIPLQIVHRNVSPRIQFKNLAEVDFSQVKSALKVVLKKDLKKSYAVHDVGLWRIYVIKLPALEYGVLLSCHHAVLDGWSNASFFTELFNVYESLKKDENYKPSSLRASYKDFVRAQLLANEDECTLEFWKHELTDFVKTPMPFDKNAFNIYGEKNYQLLKEYRVLDEKLSLRIIEFSKKNNLDLKSIFLASFVYLLKFTTGESEITLGLVASNRPEIDDGDKVLGCFLNTIPFRVSVDSYGDPRGFINSIKNKLRTMKSYDSASLIKITEVLKAHDGHSNPFFDVAFDFLDFHIFNDVNDKLNATDPIVNDYDKTNTLLDLDLTKWGNSFVVNLKTRKGLYSNDEVKRLLGYYTNILCQIVDNHTLNIREIFSKKELKTIAKITHGLVRPLGSASILEAINAHFIQLPHKVAVQQDNLFFTYQFVGKLCCNLSNYFKHSFGLAHGSRVVVMLSRSADYVNVVLSIWMADCIYIPIDPNWPEKRIMDVLNDVDPALVICESDARIALQKSVASKFRLVKFEDFDLKGSVSPEAFNVSLLTEKAAYILFTSGSTGVPKGAVVGHLGMLNHILAKTADLSINANDRIAQTATSTFDISIWQMFASLVAGASVVVYNDKLIIETSKFLQRLEKDAITILQVVPVYFSEIVVDIQESYTRPLFRSLKYLISTGEMLNREVVSQWYSLFPLVEIVNAYGPTEASDDITHFFVPKDWTNNMIPIGKPIQNTVVSILDQEGNLCPIGVKGEICAEGVGVCFGYLNRQRLSSAVFSFKEQSLYPEKPYLYCTGDIGKYNSEGLLEFYGRSDRQIKIQGNRVELQEIEEALLAFNKIKQVMVYHQLNGAQNLLIAVYTSYNGEQVENKELRRFLQSSLPQYMIPSLFQKLDTFPTTESGKVDRQAIISAYNEIFVQEQLVDDVSLGYSAESLMTIWKKMLNVETVGVDQNFFFLGGHSLKANKLAFEINHIFNVDFTLFQVFQMPTIREQAAYIDERNQLHVVNTGKYRISKSLRIGTFNLTPQQRQIWLASLSPDAKSAYLIFNTAVIAGELDVARFVDSFRLLVRRHDILRATIITRGGEPFQSIIPYEQFNLDYTFLAITDDDRRAEQIDLISVGESMKPFELSIGPLFRFKILKVSETKHIFLFTIHHIIADGWSMEILLDELGEIYKSLALEAESNWMSQPELQFEDYVSWFENTFSEAEKEKSRNYWLTLFPELPPILKLPTDYPTPSHQSFEGQIVKFTLEEKFSDLIYSMAFRENVSVYTVLISLWEIAFYKISGQVDITVGIVDAGRYSKDLDHMVGCFVKTWPLRINVDPTNNIDKLIASVSDGMVAAMENWLFPLDLLVEHLNNKLAYPHHALFNVALSFNDSFVNNDQSLLFSDLHIDELDLAQAQYSKFDLVINMWNENGKFVFEVTYRTSLFKESTIQSLSGIFKAILNSLEKDQSTALYKLKGKDLSSFFSAERHSINQKFDFDIK